MVEAYRASEARYAGIVSIAAVALISIDEQQRIVVFNEAPRKSLAGPQQKS